MSHKFFIALLILFTHFTSTNAQNVDLTSVDEFLLITSALKEGKSISEDQWISFDNSAGYRPYAMRENKNRINLVKACIVDVFSKTPNPENDSILSLSEAELKNNMAVWVKKHVLINYLDMQKNDDSIVSFRENYDFSTLIEKSKDRLFSFLGQPYDTAFNFKTVYFHCMEADGQNDTDGLFIDFNKIYKSTEAQRMNFLAHEFFHNYREKFENHNFNYQSDLNHSLDFIQNEGIADLIDKPEGYEKYFTEAGESPEMVEIWVNLYRQAPEDLKKLQHLILRYANDTLSESEMVDQLIEIVRFNGHPIGFFMANQIVKAGFKNEMLKTFYNPYAFYALYNQAAKTQNLFQLNEEFMSYLRHLTQEHYQVQLQDILRTD